MRTYLTALPSGGWPDWLPHPDTGWILPTVGAGVGLAAVTLTATVAYRAGHHRPTRPPAASAGVGAKNAAVLLTPAEPTSQAEGRDPAEAGAVAWTPVETALTLAAAGMATALAVSGMLQVFTDALGFTGPARWAMAGFLEIALMVSAIRARRSLLATGSVGVDGAAVWAMAVLSAVLAAADSHGLARAVRFVAPLTAAWLWERGLAAERRRTRPRTPATIAWRVTRARIAVWAGLADPIERQASTIDRDRRIARLTRARLHLAVIEDAPPAGIVWRTLTCRRIREAFWAWRLRRHSLAALQYLHLATDPTTAQVIRVSVAAVTGIRAHTATTALHDASPWTSHPQAGPDQDGHLPPPAPPASLPATTADGELQLPALPPICAAIPDGSIAADPAGSIDGSRTQSWSIEPQRIDPPSIEGCPVAGTSIDLNHSAEAAPPIDQLRVSPASANGRYSISLPAPVDAGRGDRSRSMSDLCAAVSAAVAAGQLPEQPAAEAIRRLLHVSPSRARALRDHLRAGPGSVEAG